MNRTCASIETVTADHRSRWRRWPLRRARGGSAWLGSWVPRFPGLPLVLALLPLLPLMATATGCGGDAKGGGDPPSVPGQHENRDTIRYDAGMAPLDFIKIVTVAASSSSGSLALPGRVTFNEDQTQRLASPIDGRAAKVLVKVGEKVRAGEPLVQLSSPSVGQIQADAQKTLSDLSLSEKSLERIRKLQADGAIAAKDVAQAEADHRKAVADYARVKAQLSALGVSATDPAVYVGLRAQISGTVVERNVLLGQEVRADKATPLMTVSNLETLWVQGDVYEQDLSLVKQGDPVVIRVPAYPDETFKGVVGHVSEVVDPGTHTVKVRCIVPNPDLRLKPEMFAQIDVQSRATRDAIYLPSKAVLNDGDKALVIVATAGNTFRERVVSAGADIDGQVRILRGLTPGEKIVADGAIFMKREVESQ